MTEEIAVFKVLRDVDRTRIETNGEVLGWGVTLPCGRSYIDWNREAYPPEDRLTYPHISEYGSLEDVEQGTGGTVEMIETFEVKR